MAAIIGVPVESERIERTLVAIADVMAGQSERRIEIEDREDVLLELEVGINYLLDELELRRKQSEAHERSLREQAEQIAMQATTLVAALSTPIIGLWPGVLVLPLIGEFDSERAAETTIVLLERVAKERARYVILDLTGVRSITAGTASALLHMVGAARLLGVECLMTGIQASAAREFVELDGDLGRLRTLARVSDALEIVLRDGEIRR